MPLFWSVEREGDTVLAICPEPLRAPDVTRPAWMEQCAAAIRDELRLLPIAEGTLLAATMTGEPGGVALESALLSHRGIPQAHVHDGVRFALLPAAERGVVLRYRREPIVPAGAGAAGAVIATLLVPVTPAYELAAATASWAAAPADAADRGLALQARFVVGAARVFGSVEFIELLLASARSSLSISGAGLDIRAVDVVFESGDPPQLAVELRTIAAAADDDEAGD
jgi:hypothetical protein